MTDPELIRIVRMTLRPEAVEEFLELLEGVAPKIRGTAGCCYLELWRDMRYPNILTTFSKWASEEALTAYRESALFQETWQETRRLFAAPPAAASHRAVPEL